MSETESDVGDRTRNAGSRRRWIIALLAVCLIAARQTVRVTTNQYQAGTVNYLNVIAAQAAALNNEIASLNILGRRMAASVLLVKALGGGWDNTAPISNGKPGDTKSKPAE
jgi:outer membrane protein TolC